VKSLLIVAAVNEELAELIPQHTALAKKWGCQINMTAVGVGPLFAGMGLVRAIQLHSPDGILGIGTCGLYSDAYNVFEPVSPVKHHFISADVAAARAYFPADNYPVINSPGCKDYPEVVCNTSPAIHTLQADINTLLEHHNFDIEHMESYALVTAANFYQIPIQLLLCPVNTVGPDAHREFTKNVRRGIRILTQQLSEMERFFE
jgi:nucleoside phosphorylase